MRNNELYLKQKYVIQEFQSLPQPMIVRLPEVKGKISKVIQIACGQKHTVLLDSNGLVFGFGDNSAGQLLQEQNQFVVRQPKLLKTVSKFQGMTRSIFTCDRMSLMTYERDCQLSSRKFFAWGDKTIIDLVSGSAKINGDEIFMPEVGTHGRGGSYLEDGLFLVDQLIHGSQPYNMFTAYQNVAIIQEKASDIKE